MLRGRLSAIMSIALMASAMNPLPVRAVRDEEEDDDLDRNTGGFTTRQGIEEHRRKAREALDARWEKEREEEKVRTEAALSDAEDKRLRKQVKNICLAKGISFKSLTVQELNAMKLYASGEKPTLSSGLEQELTCGYGKLGEYGYWEYPLPYPEKFCTTGE